MISRTAEIVTALAVLVSALGLAGCGSGGTTTVIEKTVSISAPSNRSASTPQDALKAYDLAWAEGDAEAACELLVDSGRRAVETQMSNRTLGGLPLNCPERMKEVLELLGPEAAAQLEGLAARVPSDKVSEHGDVAEITVNPAVFMELRKVGGAWYINGSTIKEIEPLVTREEIEEYEEAEGEEERAAEQAAPEINLEAAEDLALRAVKLKSGEEVPYLGCPGGTTAVVGKTFICDASSQSGEHYQAELEVVSPEGDLVVLRAFVSHEY
jgi:hypothetical protein